MNEENGQLLKVKNLEVVIPTARGTVRALNQVDLHQEYGENVGLVGESGAGKSMLGRAIMGLLPYPARVAGGEIRWNGESLLNKPARELRKLLSREIAMVFQDPISALNPLQKIGNQIIEAILLHQRVSKSKAVEQTVKMLAAVGLPLPEVHFHNFPHQYSGGMRQRVMIALALINNPRLVVADEPTTALDVTIQAQILMLLKRLQEERRMSVLLITHDLGVVAQFCSRIYVMYAGRMVESADTKDIFHRPLHPYTRALLLSAVRRDGLKGRLTTIPGIMPDLIDMPAGCAFHPRCDRRAERCGREAPVWCEVDPGHWAACFNIGG
ncbi:MAG: ABC transporter ATP-binding protein [Thermodesulfobacteriota bacterium]